ncbi:hypothetical protein GKC56_02290 [Neisseriaceae bacterium PsAf]|nr:hypothetical protein [Neisseriaceae bacterium PsAf]
MENNIDEKELINKNIDDYLSGREKYWKRLNSKTFTEWLFLATLASLGVPNPFLQIMAIFISIIFVSRKLSSHLPNGKSLIGYEKEIRNKK